MKIMQSLADANVFDKIYFIGTWESSLAKVEILDKHQTVIRIQVNLYKIKPIILWKYLKILKYYSGVFMELRNMRVDCINCHALPLLPLCVVLKFVKHSKLVYDTHELETETAALSRFRRFFSKIVEKMLISFVDEIIAVSQSIAIWYQRRYNLGRVWVVKNAPYTTRSPLRKTALLRNLFGIQENEILFLYQGLLAEGRGIRLLLGVFSQLNSDRHIVFMGFGELSECIKDYASRYKNIHYHSAVKPSEIVDYSNSADVGVSLIENICLSYYYCLPNKIWEYLNASLPILVSDFPEMGRVVDEYQCGWKTLPYALDIRCMVEKITRESVERKKRNVIAARGSFGWHLEERRLLSVYRKLGFLA